MVNIEDVKVSIKKDYQIILFLIENELRGQGK